MGKYDYYEPEVKGRKNNGEDIDGLGFHSPLVDSVDIFKLPQKIEKNSYQTALDTGGVKSGMLNVENTKYWSDFNKLIYKPNSLTGLTNWVHDPSEPLGYSKNGAERKFDNFFIGVNEYKDESNTIDSIETFRAFLEDCDLFQGLNVLTEVDSGWGGFTNELLVDIKDEYFNNGGEGKYSFWVWSLYNNDLKLGVQNQLSRIKTTLELIKSSTLYFGLGQHPNYSLSSIVDTSEFNQNSLWHTSALKALVIDDLWSINNQHKLKVNMNQFEGELLRGNAKRNIVGNINLHQKGKQIEESITDNNNINGSNNNFGIVDVPRGTGSDDIYNLYTQVAKVDDPQNASLKIDNFIDFTTPVYQNSKPDRCFSKSYITPAADIDVSELNKKHIKTQNPFPITQYELLNPSTIIKNYTFPKDILNNPEQPIFTEFGITSKPKELLQSYSKYLQRSSRINARGGAYNFDNFELEEMIEETNNLIEEYTYEWEDDDEEWD